MKRGFTMVELILTMSLLAVIALLFVSYPGHVGSVSVDGLSWKIQADIRHAQQLATSTGVPHGVNFVRYGNYVVYKDDVATPVADPLDRQPMVKSPTDFGSVAIDNDYQIQFDAIGKPTIGGGGSVNIVAENGAARRVHVIENTGAVVVDVLGLGSGCSCTMCASGGVDR